MPETITLPPGFDPANSKPLPFEAPDAGLRLRPGINIVAVREIGQMTTAEIVRGAGGPGDGATIQSVQCWHCHRRPGSEVFDCYEIRCPPAKHKPPTF